QSHRRSASSRPVSAIILKNASASSEAQSSTPAILRASLKSGLTTKLSGILVTPYCCITDLDLSQTISKPGRGAPKSFINGSMSARESSVETATTTTSPLVRSASFTIDGNSSMHGLHHDAQKFTTIGFPLKSESLK